MRGKLFLFGTGKISKRYTELFCQMPVEIEGYIDNDRDKWGALFYGKKIYGPEILSQISEPVIFIACAAREEITLQLSRIHLEGRIITFRQIIKLYGKAVLEKACLVEKRQEPQTGKTVIIDNLYGTWGGAEDWSHIVASALEDRKWEAIVVEQTVQQTEAVFKKNVMHIETGRKDQYQVYTELTGLLMQKKPFVFFNVWNSELLWAAVTVKTMYPEDVRIISNILNDTDYSRFCEWDADIDLYLCISSRIQNNLIDRCFIDRQKVCFRPPFIESIRKVDKRYSIPGDRPLKIGFPCRLTDAQKRADLIPELIRHLEESGTNYLLNIAGDGPCEALIREYVEENSLDGKVRLYGKLSRLELFDFLDQQDIYVNFSEYEGTSLTMLEAMASGCVPVVTDVSGVGDFIEDRVNGLIANVGDIEKIAKSINFLDKNRCKLAEYGKKCMRIVRERCRLGDYIDDMEKMIDAV